MDNVCHTLAGLAIGETGLKKQTALAAATLMIGANLPDVDVLAYPFGGPVFALSFRRGWTHGVLAMVLWPLVLTALMLGIGALIRRLRPKAIAPPNPRGLLLLSAIAVWSHPLLDLMNTYGVRLLMPFSNRWFYGDTLFIIDLWVLLALVAGITYARRAQRNGSPHPFRPARVALAAVAVYLVAMKTTGLIAERAVVRAFEDGGVFRVNQVMVGPVPLNPLRRYAVVRIGETYRTADVYWFTAKLGSAPRRWGSGAAVVPSGAQWLANFNLPETAAAAGTLEARRFLTWARFPLFELPGSPGCAQGFVCLADLRYYGQGWAQLAVPVSGSLSSPASHSAMEQP